MFSPSIVINLLLAKIRRDAKRDAASQMRLAIALKGINDLSLIVDFDDYQWWPAVSRLNAIQWTVFTKRYSLNYTIQWIATLHIS